MTTTICTKPTKVLITLLWILLLFSSSIDAADNSKKAEPTNKFGKSDKSSLRCWQQGKLLFTEMDWDSFTVANKDNVQNFTKDGDSNSTLSLINMGESLCLFKQTN